MLDSHRDLLHVTEVPLKTEGNRAYAVMAPKHWDDLTMNFRSAESVISFK